MLRIARRNVEGPGSEEMAFDEIMIGYTSNSLQQVLDSQMRQGK